ncbi:MAG: single-strand DNA-binding protein [Candidatus Midichloriaceae bacterium]|jgi:single-strand DNA-binding protein
MAGSVNKATVVGNVGNQPEIRVAQVSGEELATFSLATSERWKDKSTGEQKEKTEWHRVVVFSPGLVKVVKEYVNKGSKLYIEGKMQTREYQDEAGVKKYTTEIVLTTYGSTLILLDSKKDSQGFPGSHDIRNDLLKTDQKKQSEDGLKIDIDDEIPF